MNLKRVLEVEVMDTAEEARDYDAMDHASVNQLFVTDFLGSGFSGREILDLGTGTAQIPIALCRQSPACRVMAVDMAMHMLELAKTHVQVAGLQDRIQLAQADAKRLPYPDQMFDAVMSNSILHHLPRAETCLAEALRVVRTGGLLFFRDLLRPESDAELGHLVDVYTSGESEHARQMFADSLRAAFTLAEIRSMIGDLGFPGSSVQQTSDRHWTFIGKPAN